MSDIPMSQWIVAIAACYGAGLSTIIAIKQWSSNKPKMKIDVIYSFSDYDGSPPDEINLRARNFGRVPIALSYAYINEVRPVSLSQRVLYKLGKPRPIIIGYKIYPLIGMEHSIVEPGKSIDIPFDFNKIPQQWWGEKMLQGVVVDQLGGEYLCEFKA